VILVFAIFAFALLFGTLGVILAAPLTVVLKVALDTFYRPEPVA
jgi:predicted PurR-regulated permease PerM